MPNNGHTDLKVQNLNEKVLFTCQSDQAATGWRFFSSNYLGSSILSEEELVRRLLPKNSS